MTTRLDDNLVCADDNAVQCYHCNTTVGHRNEKFLAQALWRERPSSAAGPNIHAKPELFVDRQIVLRQAFCPGCYTVLLTEVVPIDEPTFRLKEV